MPRTTTGTKRALFTALATVTALPLAGALTGPVTVTGGQIAGVRGSDPSVMVFKGIPFAAPPVTVVVPLDPADAEDWVNVT